MRVSLISAYMKKHHAILLKIHRLLCFHENTSGILVFSPSTNCTYQVFFKYDHTKFTVELMCVFYYHCFLVIWVKAHLTPYCVPWSKVRDRHNFDRWYLDSKCAGPVVVILDKTRWHFCKEITWSFHHSIWNASKYKNFGFNQWLGWFFFFLSNNTL